jgi:thiosulfate reductase/polysulfide reductase chain A
MGRVKLEITRRDFMRSALAGGGGMALALQGTRGALAAGPLQEGEAAPWFTGELKTTYSVCDMCPWRCGIVVQSDGERVYKIDGNPADPKSRGKLCARGQGGVSFMYDPDRLQAPMVRTGERGEGKFQEVTWTEALDAAAEKLNAIAAEYGPESVAVFGHTSGEFWFTDYWAQAWGTPNAAKPASSLCTSPREEAAKLTYGLPIGGHEPVDWEAVQCITLIGSHIGEDARNTVMQDYATAVANGAKVIVVDPRLSTVASKADYWLPIKPGTDTALLLAWTNVIINEALYDAAYIEQWVDGFEELKAHVADYTPEWAAEICDLPAELIATTARVMAERAPQAVIVPGRHVTWYGNDSQRMRATYIINALLGAYGQVGGIYFSKSPYIEAYPHPPFTITGSSGGCSAEPGEESATLPAGPTGKVRADGVRSTFLRGATALQELIEPMITGEPYPIKALIVYGCNLLNGVPNRERTMEALKNLDFVLVIDVLPMEHVAWADIVMPEATVLERWDELWTVSHKTPYIALREPAVAPYADTQPAWWMARELGLRTGLEKWFKWETAEEYVNARLATIGSSTEKLHEAQGVIVQKPKAYFEDFNGKSPFPTPSGKIQLYSHELELAGLDPMPTYEATEEPPEGYFRLLYGRSPVHTFAKTQNTPLLHELDPENVLWLNASVASELKLKDGREVYLENQDGAVTGPIKLKVTERIRPDAVFMVHGWGQNAPLLTQANGVGASDTVLQTRYALDPISGGAGMRINFVRIKKGK